MRHIFPHPIVPSMVPFFHLSEGKRGRCSEPRAIEGYRFAQVVKIACALLISRNVA